MARIENNADGIVIVYAVSGWKYATLIKGDSTNRGIGGWSDPDNFCAYEVNSRNLINVSFKSESAEIWRLHDTCRVEVKKDSSGNIILETLTASILDPHRCVGSWSRECSKDKSLNRNSAGLNYPVILPAGIDISKSSQISLP